MTQLESLLALMALVTLMTLCAMVLKHHSRQSAALSTAQLLKKSGLSVRSYLEDHSEDHSNEMNKINIVSELKLINAGYFFPQQPNAYQQHHHLQVVRDASQTHVCIITQNGNPIPLGDWKCMAPLLEGYGGYCDQKTGDLIGWQQPLNAQLTPLLKPGHLFLCYPLHTPQMPSLASAPDRLLYRKKIPTHPQYQQMKTHLDMQQHAIVFEAPHQQGTLTAQGLEFQHTTPTGRHHRAAIEWTSQGETAYQITLQAPEQHQLRISPSAVHLTAPSIVTKHSHFNYDPVKKRVTWTPIPPHYGLQWHREWHQLPYHHLPYPQLQTAAERQKELNHAAQRICFLKQYSQPNQLVPRSKKNSLYSHLGRLFIVGNFYQQQSTVFICGKSSSEKSPRAYRLPIFSSPPPLEENMVDPLPPVKFIEEKQVTGLNFYGLDQQKNLQCWLEQLDEQKQLQLYLFLCDSAEKIQFFLNEEEAILKYNESKDIKYKPLVDFIQTIEDYKKATITLETVKGEAYLKRLINDYKKLSSPYFNNNQENIPDLLLNYFLHRSKETTSKIDNTHKTFIKSLLKQLKKDEKIKTKNLLLENSNVKLFLSQMMTFKELSPTYWMQTVYVLSTAEHSAEDPLYEFNLLKPSSN